MKQTKRLLALALALAMTGGLLAGCGQSGGNTESSAAGSSQEQATAAEAEGSTAAESTAAETENAGGQGATREITDMAGRTVTVPTEIETVFSTDPTTAIFLYVVAPEKMLNWNYELNDLEKSIILDEYETLPNFGMGDAINYEAVIAANPSIALYCSSTATDSIVSTCDQLSQSLGIPVVAVDNDLKNSAEAFRFMGDLLGVEEHAEEMAVYAEELFQDMAALQDIPEEERVRVYYGNGEDSLETAPNGSDHAQILDEVCAINVADLELGDGGRVQISAEHLLAWDPDVIVVNGEPKADISGGSAAQAILDDPTYASLKAVQEGQVYGTPNAPFSWIDRPPGPNRLIGMRWFSALLYSDYLECDVEEEVREFFDLFYHVELTDEELDNVLQGKV